VEASQAEVPLLLLTADRPHRLRDTDANQAIDQLRLFGAFPRGFFEIAPPTMRDLDLRHLRVQACRAVALAKGPPAGPVHLNLPFEKPLEPVSNDPEVTPGESVDAGEDGGLPAPVAPSGGPGDPALFGRGDGSPFVHVPPVTLELSEEARAWLLRRVSESPRGVIVAGPMPDATEVGPAVVAMAAATGYPLLADPLSGARFGPTHGAEIVAGYDLFLRSGAARRALRPDFILRVGASPTSASALAYILEHQDVPQVVLDDGHRWKDHTSSAHDYLRASPAPLLAQLALEVPRVGDPGWRALWEEAQGRTLKALEDACEDRPMEGWILRDVARVLPENARLVISSSMPVRDLDAFGLPRQEPLVVYGNRGASGIDGVVSTTLGIGAASSRATVGVLGDLAFLHDMNGLLVLEKERIPVGFVVVNNDGGGIFHTLPVRDFEPSFTRYFVTPHGLDLGDVARLYRLRYERMDGRNGFGERLRALVGLGEPFLLEVTSPREEGHARRREILDAVEGAMEGLGALPPP